MKLPYYRPLTSSEKCSQDLVTSYISMLNVEDCEEIMHWGTCIKLGDVIHLDDILSKDIDHHAKHEYINQIYEVTRIMRSSPSFKHLNQDSSYYAPSIWIKPLFSEGLSVLGPRPYKLDSILFTVIQSTN